jgi:hypothetical protein
VHAGVLHVLRDGIVQDVALWVGGWVGEWVSGVCVWVGGLVGWVGRWVCVWWVSGCGLIQGGLWRGGL